MYKEGYVISVIANGNILEESDRKVAMPFGQEYKVRLINKSHLRCAADLVINGEKIGRFILDAGQNSDIERYLDGNLNNGKRFQFVSLNDSKVSNKNDIENGFIEVSFFQEKKKQDPIIIREEHHHHHHDWDHYPIYPKPWHPWQEPYPWKYCNCDGTLSANSESMMNFSADATSCRRLDDIDGATVRGSESKQEFKEVYGLEFEYTPVVIKLKIINGETQVINKYCSGCGRKRIEGQKYCGNCGTKL